MSVRKVFLTKEQSLALRGIAILLVIASHYAEWFGEVLANGTLQYGLTRLGSYGVDIFFLVSGYGLAKSVGKRQIGGVFLWHRLKNVYLPYLLIAGLIECYGGGLHTAVSWYKYLTGFDYWYIRNILLFYLAFYLAYRIADRGWTRLLLLAALIGTYSWWLYSIDRAAFWYISNLAFLVGILLAQYERALLRAASFLYPLQLLLLIAGMAWAVKTGLAARLTVPPQPERAFGGLLAALCFSLLAAQAGGLSRLRGRWIETLGSFSLELYLCHMFLFYRVVNSLTDWGRIPQGLLALALAMAVSWCINRLFGLLWGAAERLGAKV
ncbi:MAG: acyltransferase [Eubacteriales bacterium]|nr:acyltransferase [Eubacteriales bacterium]